MIVRQPEVHRNTSPYRGKLYPSGDGGLGYNPPSKKSSRDRQYDSDYQQQFDTYEVTVTQGNRTTRQVDQFFAGGHEERHQIDPDNVGSANRRLNQLLERQGKPPLNIGLSAPRNLRKTPERPVRYGARGITSNGKRRVRSGCQILEDIYGKERLGFLTVTLPSERTGVSMTQLRYIAENYDQYKRRFLEELEREVVRNGGDSRICGVVELHPKRSIKVGFPVPHIHILFNAHGGDYKHYATARKLREINQRVIANLLDCSPESIDTSASVDVQSIRKSASKYLSKYMSKDEKSVEGFIKKGEGDCLPRQWWFCRGGMSKTIDTLTIELTGQIAQMLIESHDLFLDNGWLAYWKPVEINVLCGGVKHTASARYRRMVVGYAFGFTQEGMKEFVPMALKMWFKGEV